MTQTIKCASLWFDCEGRGYFSSFGFGSWVSDLRLKRYQFMLTDHRHKGKHVAQPYRGLTCTNCSNSSQSACSSNERERFQTWIE